MTCNSLHSRRGQFLVESIVALSVLTLGFLGLVALLARSLSLNRIISDTHTATYLAAEGTEIIKNIIDANVLQDIPWGTGTAPGNYEVEYDSVSLDAYLARQLRYSPATNLYTYGGSEVTPFVRRIQIQDVGGEELLIESRVTWAVPGAGNFEVRLEDHFLKWRQF